MPRSDRDRPVRPSEAHDPSFVAATPDDWTDPTVDLDSPGEALDAIAGGRAGVVLIAATQPTDPGQGVAWLDTAATGTGGSGVLTVNTITVDTTLTTSNTVVLCDATTGAITVMLPAASGNGGRTYYIKKIDSSVNTVTVDANASETIDGDLTAVITLRYESITLVCDGSNWHLI